MLCSHSIAAVLIATVVIAFVLFLLVAPYHIKRCICTTPQQLLFLMCILGVLFFLLFASILLNQKDNYMGVAVLAVLLVIFLAMMYISCRQDRHGYYTLTVALYFIVFIMVSMWVSVAFLEPWE
jgi:hypothetical protein